MFDFCRMCGKKHRPSSSKTLPLHVLSRGGYEYLEQKLMAEKTKKRLEEAAQSRSTEGVIDPPSPIGCHVKWKMARTKQIGQMTSEVAKEIAEKIISHFQLRIVIIFVYSVNALDKYVSCTGFFGVAGVTGIVRPTWTSGCLDYCHWATRASWSCLCC